MKRFINDSTHYKKLANGRVIHSVLGYILSITLTGVPPMVCESWIDNIYSSVKRSADQFLHLSEK